MLYIIKNTIYLNKYCMVYKLATKTKINVELHYSTRYKQYLDLHLFPGRILQHDSGHK